MKKWISGGVVGLMVAWALTLGAHPFPANVYGSTYAAG